MSDMVGSRPQTPGQDEQTYLHKMQVNVNTTVYDITRKKMQYNSFCFTVNLLHSPFASIPISFHHNYN